MSEMKSPPANRTIHLDNCACPYCGINLDSTKRTKEHVIGRRFVPKGKLNGHWNLIVFACDDCNGYKADLEDDISAISLVSDSEKLPSQEAQRKINKSISRRTGKPVRDSYESFDINGEIGPGVTYKINMVSPPQIDRRRAFDLARMQLSAFFFLITYQEKEKRGYFWPGEYLPLTVVNRADWGNAQMIDFSQSVIDWDTRFIGYTADEHFRLCIRRKPDAEVWSWAIEWNGAIRLVGFLGDRSRAEAIASSYRKLKMYQHQEGEGSYIRYRFEVPLAPEDDQLFSVDL